MKRYLLIAGTCYYPSAGTGDWQRTFETEEEINALITEDSDKRYDSIHIEGIGDFDWYRIVDLNSWINPPKDTGFYEE